MAKLARQHNIHLLTNYETTWYGSNDEAYRLVHEENTIGELRKVAWCTRQPWPKEIEVNEEFLEWLTDPKWNGAGALTDFGCYGRQPHYLADGRRTPHLGDGRYPAD